jgi:hypothetical protein
MTATEAALLLFTACNSLRVLAYVPQIVRIAHDRDGAAAISCMTWALFAVSHLSTVAYAALVLRDPTIALVFAGNTLACLAILGLTWVKRRRYRAAHRVGEPARRRVWPGLARTAGAADPSRVA